MRASAAKRCRPTWPAVSTSRYGRQQQCQQTFCTSCTCFALFVGKLQRGEGGVEEVCTGPVKEVYVA